MLIAALYFPAENADAHGVTCLFDSTSIYIKDNLTATVDVSRAFEITSEAGQEYAQVAIPINDNIEVKNIRGYTELRGGVRVRLTKDDIGISSSVGLGGFGGMRLMIFTLRNPALGSRLYYQYTLDINSLLYLPKLTRSTDYYTDRFSVDVSWDKKVNVRYDAIGVDVAPGDYSVHFGASDLAEVPQESNSCPDQIFIMLSTESFSYDKMRYWSRSWPEVGRFFAQLAVQPEASMAEAKTMAQQLSRNAETWQDTLNTFFNFVADSVSYVSLEVGKGDFNPHNCSVIINRRFGDCKDQSILLSSFCQAAGINAYPALIFTGTYPALDSLHPWPAWFDHVVTVIKRPDGDLILDPSDPRASATSLPPRLRGKSYLICDGISELKTTPPETDPAFIISWQFEIQKIIENRLGIEFSLRFINDAADIYQDSWKGKGPDQIAPLIETQLKNWGWDVSSFKLDRIETPVDSLNFSGSFSVSLQDIGDSKNLALTSPVLTYLLVNIFPDVRKNAFCPNGSIQLDERITINRSIPGLLVGTQYDDSWERPGLLFRDQLLFENGDAVYHRLFFSSGDPVKVEDYNACRDLILARQGQQYVRLQK